MAYYTATVNPGPGLLQIEIVADNCGSGATHCTLSLKRAGDPEGIKTSLWAKDLDALISSLQAARSHVTQ